MSWVRGNRSATIPARRRSLGRRSLRNSPKRASSNSNPRCFVNHLKTNSLLILACILASLWAWQQDPAFAEKNLIFSLSNFENGRVWTIVVALFVHANVLHLFGNMLFLFVFGRTLEKTVGPQMLLAIFFTGGFVSFILGLGLFAARHWECWAPRPQFSR